jgi:hypothetical protein
VPHHTCQIVFGAQGLQDTSIPLDLRRTMPVGQAKFEAVTRRVSLYMRDGQELQDISIPLDLCIEFDCFVHGIACWFDVLFPGGEWLSTAPGLPTTHWFQVPHRDQMSYCACQIGT